MLEYPHGQSAGYPSVQRIESFSEAYRYAHARGGEKHPPWKPGYRKLVGPADAEYEYAARLWEKRADDVRASGHVLPQSRRRKNPRKPRKASFKMPRFTPPTKASADFYGVPYPEKKPRKRKNPAGDHAKAMLAFTVRRAGRAVGTVVAKSARAAAAEAKAAGLELGREVKREGLRRLCKSNPPQGATLSDRAEALTYKHAEDGEWYRHTWRPGVMVKVSKDKRRVTLYRPDGKPVAGNFFVPTNRSG